MSHVSDSSNARSRLVCPDCGESFSARGLSGHRRLRHNVAPAPALPGPQKGPADALPAILGALTALRVAIETIEGHVAAMRETLAGRKGPAQEAAELEGQLAELLEHIARIKETGLAATTIRRPATPVEEQACLELARLRREQARVVFRLEELRAGRASDDLFLT